MQTSITSGPDWDLVTLEGDITSADTGALGEILQRFLTGGRYHVILDLSRTTYIGSAGLSLLIRYAKSFRRWERGDLYLAALPASIRDLLQVAGLISAERSHFSIYPSVNAAKKAAQKRTMP